MRLQNRVDDEGHGTYGIRALKKSFTEGKTMIPRFSAECMACAVARQAQNMPDVWTDEKRAEYLKGVMKIIFDADPSEGAPVVNGKIDILAEKFGIEKRDYTFIKRDYNLLMLKTAEKLRAKIEKSSDPLAEAIKIARTANYIDFGTQVKVTEDELLDLLEKSGEDGLNASEYGYFRKDIECADSLVYLTDNCGEIVADMLLIEQLKKLRPDMKITVIVRGMPVINDATMEDARMVGMDKIAEVMGNGNGIAGTSMQDMDELSLSRLKGADVVISKGQANFETLNGCGMNIYYLFLCKCGRFERRFHMSRLQGVIANDRRLEC